MRYLILSLSFLVFGKSGFAQICPNPLFTDNFSSATGWTSVGTGNVYISGGVCVYNNTIDHTYDRMYKTLPQPLSDSCFRINFKFTFLPNSSGNGVGVNILSVCNGILDPIDYDVSQNFAWTNQDGLILQLVSTNAYDNSVNDWRIELQTKKGTIYTHAPNSIYLSNTYSAYYVEFERISLSNTYLSIYTDSLFTNLLGQVSNSIDPTITGLNILHTGVATGGWTSRHFTGTLDNIRICKGCDLTAIAPVIVNRDPEILCPNVFTPNGDGVNDQLVFTNLEYYDAELSVYDRWGKLVYNNVHYKNDWTGKDLNSQNELLEGTYYYVLYVPSTKKYYKGFVELLK